MTHQQRLPYGMIILSLLVAVFLNILPMPLWSVWFRPEWVVLVVLFWIMTFPDSINVGTAWSMGLVLDALNGSLLGEHALALAAVGYLMAKWQRQVVVFPLWQTAFVVGILIFIYKLIIVVLQGLIGEPLQSLAYGFSILTSLLFWPWVQAVLAVRQPYGAQA